MEYITLVVSIITLLVVLYVALRKGKNTDGSANVERAIQDIQKRIEKINTDIAGLMQNVGMIDNNIKNSFGTLSAMQSGQLKQIEDRLNAILNSNEDRMNKIATTISNGLSEIQKLNSQELEKMRATVDEKLSETLNKRFNESFQSIMTTLESVTKSAGEMQSVVSSVSDFKRMITGVKTRGVWGEVQLGNVLEQMLSPNQYASQVSIDGSAERVDFVVKLPGKNEDEIIYLPIDAKFPIEDYSRLCEASESGDVKAVEQCSKDLSNSIKKQAKSINAKYIKPPKTTEFAVMYLPVEGLYAEVVKDSSLCEVLQRDYKIIVCGPNTVTALLSSLQMGFKTLAIEKRSGEIWKLLSVFKKEFLTFTSLLDKTQKKLDEASNTIEDATKKTKTIQRKLKSVADIEGVSDLDAIDIDKE